MNEQLSERVNALAWFHRIDLGAGMITPGPDDTPTKIAAAHIPADLTGKTVIDIGAWDGAFSFECERRGAKQVLATDHFIWLQRGRATFDLASEALQSRVTSLDIRVENLSSEAVGTFDLALFLGVLYHAPNMLQYLKNLSSVCRDLAILETHIDALEYTRPAAVFYPGTTLNGDHTNFWGPNPACVEAMLEEVGFARVQRFPSWMPSRMVFHAWKK